MKGPKRLFRFLLRLYPADFRVRYGAGMEQTFHERYREKHGGTSRVAFVAFLARDFISLLVTVFYQHLANWRSWMRRRCRVLLWRRPKCEMIRCTGQDVRYGLRLLRKERTVTFTMMLSLALGIGANATIFSAVDMFLFRPLPYEDADRLVALFETNQDQGLTREGFSVPTFLDLRQRSGTMNVAARHGRSFNLSGGDRPERVEGERVSWNFFEVLRVQPHLGRTFRSEEETTGRARVCIISYGLWRRRFGAEYSIIGRSLRLDQETYTVIGVLPPGFWFGFHRGEIWTPLAVDGGEKRDHRFLDAIGRLDSDANLQKADVDVSLITGNLSGAYDETNRGWSVRVEPLRAEIYDENIRLMSVLAWIAATFVLLIVCSNAANLILARGASRGREIALRLVLGASRARVVRQLLTEAVVMSLVGGCLGLVLAVAGVRGLVSLLPDWIPRTGDIGLDGRVLLFTLVLTVLAGVVFGLVPSLQVTGGSPAEALKKAAGGNVGPRGNRLRRALVIGQTSIALTLLIASTLLVRGFIGLETTELGWSEKNILTFQISLPEKDYDNGQAVNGFYRGLLSRLSSLPGVESVGATSLLPRRGHTTTLYCPAGEQAASASQRLSTGYRRVLPGYFRTMGIPVSRGRTLGECDREDGLRVVVINEMLRERHWKDEDPVGEQIELFGATYTIVGVVQNTLDFDLEARPMAFLPAYQEPFGRMSIVLRTSEEPYSLVKSVRAEVEQMDPYLPIFAAASMSDIMRQDMAGYSMAAKIMTVLAVVALVLTLVGVYGAVACYASQRTREIGIRMAIGAEPGDVLGMVSRQGVTLTLIGVAAGALISLAVTRSLSFFLFGVNPLDPTTFVAVASTLVLAGSSAAYLPALRATRIDPLKTLQHE